MLNELELEHRLTKLEVGQEVITAELKGMRVDLSGHLCRIVERLDVQNGRVKANEARSKANADRLAELEQDLAPLARESALRAGGIIALKKQAALLTGAVAIGAGLIAIVDRFV